MFADLQEFFYLYYREIVFLAVGFSLITSVFLAILTAIRAVDET